MLKVVDVDALPEYRLTVTFNDSYQGEINVREIFDTVSARSRLDAEFSRFALRSDGSLDWPGIIRISADTLRNMVGEKGQYLPELNDGPDLENIEHIIKQAAWESIEEGRPDILQGAIRQYVEYFGYADVVRESGIKSRSSAYRSLEPSTSPNFKTLVQMGHAVVQLLRENQNV